MIIDHPIIEKMIEQATEEDLPGILSLQKLAFKKEADIVGDPDILPMTQTLDDLRREFNKVMILKYVEDGRLLGSVRAFTEGDTCHINRLIVHPDHWKRGIGKTLMDRIEKEFPDDERYELWTRIDNGQTRSFYEKLGYRPFRTEKINDALTFVYLEKRNER